MLSIFDILFSGFQNSGCVWKCNMLLCLCGQFWKSWLIQRYVNMMSSQYIIGQAFTQQNSARNAFPLSLSAVDTCCIRTITCIKYPKDEPVLLLGFKVSLRDVFLLQKPPWAVCAQRQSARLSAKGRAVTTLRAAARLPTTSKTPPQETPQAKL